MHPTQVVLREPLLKPLIMYPEDQKGFICLQVRMMSPDEP